jgi:hypothetical protein
LINSSITDLWNAKLYEGASFTKLDNPKVYCTAENIPSSVISWPKAKQLHKEQMKAGNENYFNPSFIHFFVDDSRFDGPNNSIWRNWETLYEIARHFGGIIGVDFSTYADMPEPVKRNQFHRTRTIEHGAIYRNIPVIPNVRWGSKETWSYCFDGLPGNEMLCIGTVGSGLKNIECRHLFNEGIQELIDQKHPTNLLIIGSDKYEIFNTVRKRGISVYQIDSDTDSYYKNRGAGNV